MAQNISEMKWEDLPQHVLDAMREEDMKFHAERREKGPHMVPSDTYRARMKAARERAEAKEAGVDLPERS